MRQAFVTPEWVMERFWPGGHDWNREGCSVERAWEREFEDIASRPHFWRMVEFLRKGDLDWPTNYSMNADRAVDPVKLGDDDRVWDGHHRILATHILNGDGRSRSFVVEFQGDGPWWESLIEEGATPIRRSSNTEVGKIL